MNDLCKFSTQMFYDPCMLSFLHIICEHGRHKLLFGCCLVYCSTLGTPQCKAYALWPQCFWLVLSCLPSRKLCKSASVTARIQSYLAVTISLGVGPSSLVHGGRRHCAGAANQHLHRGQVQDLSPTARRIHRSRLRAVPFVPGNGRVLLEAEPLVRRLAQSAMRLPPVPSHLQTLELV